MPNDWYNASGNPVAQSRAASATQRSENTSIEAGFAKFPDTDIFYGEAFNYGIDAGAVNAFVVSIAPTYLTSYFDGMSVRIRAANANTGATTVNVNGLGLKSILRPDGSALQAGDIAAGQVVEITYNSTAGAFRMAQAYGGPVGPTAPTESVIAPAYLNSWADYGSVYGTAGYYKMADGVHVRLTGLIKDGVVGSAAFTLPVGYRPMAEGLFGCVSNSLFGAISITTAGLVIPSIGNNTYFSLGGICFRVA